MDHPRGLEGDLAGRIRGPDRQGLEEIAGVSQRLFLIESGV
jgi:hypothetical protein